VAFEPTARETVVPARFHLDKHTFAFEQKFQPTSSNVFELSDVTFPSPVVTPQPNNNTVHCEYFQPLAPGRHPGVIVLHILGGDFRICRGCLPLARAPRHGGAVREDALLRSAAAARLAGADGLDGSRRKPSAA
jgi:hypothetical protein